MNLLSLTSEHIAWLHRVIAQFFRVNRPITLVVILASVGSRISQFVAFFLPVKVIILIGSDGFPRYFRWFAEPDQKLQLVIWLSLTAVALYAVSQLLDALAERYADVGGAQALREAATISIVNNQDQLARTYFSRFCEVYGAFVFVVAAFTLGFILNAYLFGFVLLLLLGQYGISAWLLRLHDPVSMNGFGSWIVNAPKRYVTTCSSVSFMAAFGFLIAQFYWLNLDNVIAAILSFLLARQLLQNVTLFVTGSVKLAAEARQINAMVFPGYQLYEQERSEVRRFRYLFNKTAREARAASVADIAGVEPSRTIRSTWIDPTPNTPWLFQWVVEGPEHAGPATLLEKVYPPNHRAFLQHEVFLFEHMPPDSLNAPRPLDRLEVDGFVSQFYACDPHDFAGRRPGQSLWLPFMVRAVRQQPPKKLQDSYFGSRPDMAARFDEQKLNELNVAIDTDDESALHQELHALLPTLRARIRRMPVFVFNPHIHDANTALDRSGRPIFLNWGKWRLEPVGYGLQQKHLTRDVLSDLMAAVASRGDCPSDIDPADIELVARLFMFDNLLAKRWYKAAIQEISGIIDLATYLGQKYGHAACRGAAPPNRRLST